MESVVQKKKGRPATGVDPVLTIRLPAKTLKRIDDWAANYEGMSRSTAVRCLIALGFQAPRKKVEALTDPKNPFGKYIPPKEFHHRAKEPAKPRAKSAKPKPDPVDLAPTRTPRRAPDSWIKEAADRAEARLKGKR